MDRTEAVEGPTTVTIFGRTYHLRGSGDPAYLARLATTVDERMRELAGATGTADTMKLAVLAALNLADDRIRGENVDDKSALKQIDDRVRRLVADLDEALAEDAES